MGKTLRVTNLNQRAVLMALDHHGGRMSAKEIAHAADMEVGQVRAMIGPLTMRGVVRGHGGLVGGWVYEETEVGRADMQTWREAGPR